MLLKKQAMTTVLTWVALGMFLMFSDPDRLPVVLLIAPFLLLFIALYSSWIIVRDITSRFLVRERSSRHLGLAVCVSVVLFLVLQSLGQLTLRDMVTTAAIVVLGYLYLGRARVDLRQR